MLGAFGRRVRELRVANEMTMSRLAGKLGFSAPYLCDIEMGRRNPPGPDVIGKIAKILKADPDELMELARKDRRKLVIPLESKPEFVHDVAFNLARAIDEDKLPQEIAEKISEMLTRKER
jgi:transcriptional regulator with XRE-family HTH domain